MMTKIPSVLILSIAVAIAIPAVALAASAAEGAAPRLEAEWRRQLQAKLTVRPQVRISTRSDARGGNNGRTTGGFEFHTDQQKKPWWHVDLEAAVAIDRVEIYNRCTVSERAARLQLLLSDDGKKWKTVYRHDGTLFYGHTDKKPLVVRLDGAKGRFVRVQLPGRTWLHMDEIEVYGSADPKKNIALNKPADQSSASTWSTGKPTPAAAAVALPQKPYVDAVTDVLRAGRMLAADLAAGGDTAAFGETVTFTFQAAEISAGLEPLLVDSNELKTCSLYFRARRAVRKLALSNPLLGFEKLLLVRRGSKNLALPANWQSNSSLRTTGYDNDIAVLTGFRAAPKLTTLLRPQAKRFVGDVDLHFDGEKMLFSMPNDRNQWRVFELNADGTGLGELPLIDQPDVSNYDACYLPNGNVIFSSTAPFIGVPCVRGNSKVTNLYLWERAAGRIRRLTFDQDHDWCPTVLNSGRVGYLRWEYTDLPHSNSRILFHMNPDGTGQMELYGSNSYWPNSLFYARAIPGHASKVVGIVTGHHGVRRMGELVLFDPARGQREADGAVQRIPGYGQKVEPIIRDQLVNASWPKFLHPYPLSERHFLVSARPTPRSEWGLYLADIYDNMVLLAEQPGYAMLEPVPLRPTPRAPILADKVDTKRTDAIVYLADIYQGGGLKGMPRGSVKKLRLLSYHFSYHGIGGLLGVVGADGPWDVKRILGTVPVEPDGSAAFRIPANTPIAVQPLDEKGQAMQIMRSWLVGMPGENVSCVGCHERHREAAPVRTSAAMHRPPSEIEPWRGPARGFGYAREVQPVIDRYCLGCHDPSGDRFDAKGMPDLRGVAIRGWRSRHKGNGGGDSGHFSVGYTALARYVRRPGIESNIHLLTPMEYHASTTELVQMLRGGHHGVRLDEEAWDRLITWIDLNAPYHGTWAEAVGAKRVGKLADRRRELMKLYAGVNVDDEAIPQAAAEKIEPVLPPPTRPPSVKAIPCEGWPFDAAEARRRQAALGKTLWAVDLGDGIQLELANIPPGEFVMGDPAGAAGERPAARVKIDRPFWIGRFEVTNEQFARFDPMHDSRVESKHGYQFGIHGYPVNGPRQPAVRVSWRQAKAFCDWLTRKVARPGLRFALPTEARWEYACRAGSAAAFSYGGFDVDFSKLANLGDAKLRELASDPYTTAVPMRDPNPHDDWVPKDARFNDGQLVSADVGGYLPNAWGLHDMHGNVAEWTASLALPYPYRAEDGRNDPAAKGKRIVRGGSWYDRPKRCRAAFRLPYQPHQPVYNVGFRVVAVEESDHRGTEVAERGK